jgi:protease FtsH subunit HflC
LIDLRIKRINLPSEISESIYARMRAEREALPVVIVHKVARKRKLFERKPS